jgi:hypothetical protein
MLYYTASRADACQNFVHHLQNTYVPSKTLREATADTGVEIISI